MTQEGRHAGAASAPQVVAALERLKPEPGKTRQRRDPEIVLAAIRAVQRGVSLETVALTLGRNRPGLYSLVGTWALRHCQCWRRKR